MPLIERHFAECDLCGKRGPESRLYSGSIANAIDAGWMIDINYNTQLVVSVTCPDCIERSLGHPAAHSSPRNT